ncbi:unnamed protein product [Sphenostylis stenocarpa]|uniref:Uncharacterized protein n=1 Tax=Sphenostylis stenocarpa TaxID=92480 RepID=A0AA86TIW1_9FABA|nr:unnamed protein product [Sphenostylis stenocarpa]
MVQPTSNIPLDVSVAYGLPMLPAYLNLTKGQDVKKGSLILVGEIGGNDINAIIPRKNITEIREMVPRIVARITKITSKLIKEGAIHLAVPGNFPIGCNSYVLKTVKSDKKEDYDQFGCLRSYNAAIRYYNDQLKKALETLRQKYPHVKITYFDYYGAALRLFHAPQQYGFNFGKIETFRVCCGKGKGYHLDIPCGFGDATACPDPSKHINWDGFHFTETAYKLIAKGLIEGPFANPPLKSPLFKIRDMQVSTLRSRGSMPVFIEVTASIIEIQLQDSYFRQDQMNEASHSEEMLAMLYCMAVMRLVNVAVEKTRKKEVTSIAVAADAIGILRMLIDIQHEGSHRELPTLKIVRSASVKALDWLKSYYWEPQSKAIPFQGEGITKVKKEIKSKIRELAVFLKFNGNVHQTSRPGGSKKQITKILKYVLRLYSSFSSEIVSMLLEYLLKALSSSELEENADDASIGLTTENVLADWKLILLKLCNKEPELLLNLLKEVLDMIESQEDMKHEEDNPNMGISQSRTKFWLSSLFAWLVGILSKVPSAAAHMPKGVLLELLRRCLLISQLFNKQPVDSALQITELMDDISLMQKVQKFSYVSFTWTLEKSWNPCPIGMLPRAVGSSGCLPVLDIFDNEKQNQVSSGCLPVVDITDYEEQDQLLEKKESWKLAPHGAKRDATFDLLQLEKSTVKKMRGTEEFSELNNEFPCMVPIRYRCPA